MRFQQYKFRHLANPFGVTYNPVSIKHQLERIFDKAYFNGSDVLKKGEVYNSFDLHGSFDDSDEKSLLQSANDMLDQSHFFLSSSTHVVITLGSCWVYELRDSGKTVNNCHSMPSQLFNKKLLSEKEVRSSLEKIMAICRSLNSSIHIIFNVSPVRHTKDGTFENSVSKGRLFSALHQVIDSSKSFYLPSYELIMDDLRDYRFYGKDLIHPNDLAVEYIWNKMVESMMEEESRQIMKELDQIQNAANHRPFNPKTKKHQEFIVNSLKRIEELSQKHPELDLSPEREKFSLSLTE